MNDVYLDQLQDIYSACKQSQAATNELADAASSPELKEALNAGSNGIAHGMTVAASVVRSHKSDPTDEFCKGMEGLVKEAEAHAIEADIRDPDARDAVIITQYQRMVHYAIAGWGCVVAFAKRLGFEADARDLQACLDDTYSGDRTMTEIATGQVNKAASA
ncbi:MAG: DUF892 family protein [Pseudomonadota bacterium]